MADGKVTALRSLGPTLAAALLFGTACATTPFVYTPTGTAVPIGRGLTIQVDKVQNNLSDDPAAIRFNVNLDRPVADAVREALIGELRQAGFTIGPGELLVSVIVESKYRGYGLFLGSYWTFSVHRAGDGRGLFLKKYTHSPSSISSIPTIYDAKGQVGLIQHALLQFVNDSDMHSALRGAAVAAAPPPDARESRPAPGLAAAASGSGFLVKDTNLVLTSYHVVRDRSEIRLIFPNGEEYAGRVVARDRGNDLALVEATGRPMTGGGLALAMGAEINEGQQVFALGYPLGSGLSRRPSIVAGLVSSTVGLEDDIARFRTTAPINPGSSGGPILDEWGRVVGIAAAGLVRTEVEAIRFGVKASTAALILQQARVARSFDIRVEPAGGRRRTPEEIFRETAPYVILIEAR